MPTPRLITTTHAAGVFLFAVRDPLLLRASPADFAAGKKAIDKGDYPTAAGEWEAAANNGDPAAQYCWGVLLELGRGVDKDEVAGRRWQMLSAERGYEYGQDVLAWPIRPEDTPYLTCTPDPPRPPVASATEEKPTQEDSIRGFRFRVTLHNYRAPIERLIIARHYSEKAKSPNVQVAVCRIENGRRAEVRTPSPFGASV